MTTDGPVLLVGATRGTGLLIARLLLQQGTPVRVLARDPTRAAQRLGDDPEIIRGDITQAPSLAPAVARARHIIFTAGCRSGRPVGPAKIRRTEYEGVMNTLGRKPRWLYRPLLVHDRERSREAFLPDRRAQPLLGQHAQVARTC
jgi:nucleoside-diphosphate-sugar epimerase